jgi:hypothetical protein
VGGPSRTVSRGKLQEQPRGIDARLFCYQEAQEKAGTQEIGLSVCN